MTPALLGAPPADVGALLIGLGAALLLVDVARGGPGISGLTFGGTLRTPEARASAACELVGAMLVALGSAILLLQSRALTVFLVVAVIAGAFIAIYVVMAIRLHQHMALVAKDGGGPPRSLWWCLRKPLWRPPPDT